VRQTGSYTLHGFQCLFVFAVRLPCQAILPILASDDRCADAILTDILRYFATSREVQYPSLSALRTRHCFVPVRMTVRVDLGFCPLLMRYA